ncbi:MAG: hypothetical protein LBI29_03435 [Rickettsiales bacterium]|jgi:hypothetical protein|nr:hypothetical protein [Rickettsiales bacterium]
MSLICDKGILLSVKKYNDRCSRMVLFSENNGLIQIFGKTARGSAAYQVYDFLDFRCDYVDSYNYRNLEISVLRSYLGNVFCNRLFMSIFNSAAAIALTL